MQNINIPRYEIAGIYYRGMYMALGILNKFWWFCRKNL